MIHGLVEDFQRDAFRPRRKQRRMRPSKAQKKPQRSCWAAASTNTLSGAQLAIKM